MTMREERVARIDIPPWYRGLRVNHQGYPREGYRLLAFDTETVKGWPYTLQVTDGTDTHLWYLSPEEFLPRLIQYVSPYTREHRRPVVLMGHYLAYDLPALLYPYASQFGDGPFTIACGRARLQVYYGKIPFAKLLLPGNRIVWIVDTFAFVWCSLARAAQVWGLSVQKAPRPAGLGTRVLRGRAFERYAQTDVSVTWHLGRQILALHREFDLRLCVSIAQMAARIFTHQYLKTSVPAPPPEVLDAALLAYHGGKNGFYIRPGWIQNCREYDIRSAYPWAMTQMPAIDKGTWKRVSYIAPDHEGFYQVTGTIRPDPYPVLYSHDFQPLTGRVTMPTWVTSFELREALRCREFRPADVRGYIWIPASARRPLADFVQDFYRRKQDSPPGPQREVYKLMLNSLYGKFIQLNPTGEGTERPGGYWHPPLAAWITGCVRARVHRLEHEGQALHTATDAIHTTRRLPTGAGLGDLEEVIRGPVLLLRNKVYFHFSRDGSRMKWALHGVRLKPRQFWRLLLTGRRRYTITHLLRPKEARLLGTRPLQPVSRTLQVHLGPIRLRPLPQAARLFWRRRDGRAAT